MAKFIADALLDRRIRAAALRFEDGTVVTGSWHVAAAEKARAMGKTWYDPALHTTALLPYEKGFVDNEGNFLDRQEAAKLAIAADQVVKDAAGKPTAVGRELDTLDLVNMHESAIDPNEFISDFMHNHWSYRTKTNMIGAPETWFYYGDTLQAYDTLSREMSDRYVKLLNYLTTQVGFTPNFDERMPASITDPGNVVGKWIDSHRDIAASWMMEHPIDETPASNLGESDDVASFFQQWRDNPWRYDFSGGAKKRGLMRIYFRGTMVHSHYVASKTEAEQFVGGVKRLHDGLPFEGGSFIVWYIKHKNVPKIQHPA